MGEQAVDDGQAPLTLVGGRYRVTDVLGRGGMATVYRVEDLSSGRTVALKRLTEHGGHGLSRAIELAFQREYHTLSQLAHPRVIEVYDYGVEDGHGYYTMELLDGGDLRKRSPMPWQAACAVLIDVCSCLSLLHSRRLVHRDVSPRNVHCTQGGHAKLIDFGALVPFGPCEHVVGTPPFVAPEVVFRLPLDGRTDLFSLGATLYYALTRKHAYPVRELSQLAEAWKREPLPPSAHVPGIPPALDGLVMSLLDLDPAARPGTAYEALQRLAALADVALDESERVADAYLFAPRLIGRAAALEQMKAQLEQAVTGRGSGILIGPGAGLGRSRMLDECALSAKALGATVVRAGADSVGHAPLSAAHSLVEQVQETVLGATGAGVLSEPPPVAEGATFRERQQQRLADALIEAAARAPLVVAVDDAQRIDEASLGVLATVAERLPEAPLLLALTFDRAVDAADEALPPALTLLASQCTAVHLSPLDVQQTRELLASVFGDVPNLSWLGQRLHDTAGGHPRELMDLLEHLCESGAISYVEGHWRLPAELDPDALPADAKQAYLRRVERLSPLARFLLEVQALASHSAFSRRDYPLLDPALPADAIDRALSELVARGHLVGNGWVHAFSRASYAGAITAGLSESELQHRHAALARLYEATDPDGLSVIYHLLQANQLEVGLDKLVAYSEGFETRGLSPLSQTSSNTLVRLMERAYDVAIALGRPQRQRYDMLRGKLLLSVTSSTHLYHAAGPLLLPQLERDSGLCDYRDLPESLEPAARLRRALTAAAERYASSPEHERVYRVDEAIKLLVQYVAVSIALSARTMDASIVASMPALLEPLTSLSPLVHAMWQNAVATFEMNFGAQPERAARRATEIYERLLPFTDEELPYVSVIRNAIAYGAGAMEAYLGRPSAVAFAEVLERDPLQRVNAAHLRKLCCLQVGDAVGAERHRVRAERLAARANTLQMFTRPYRMELHAYAEAEDLTRVREIGDGLASQAERFPGFIPLHWLAEGHFHYLRGDYAAALDQYSRCAELSAPDPAQPTRSITPWPPALAGVVATLLAQGAPAAALVRAQHALSRGHAAGLDAALWELERAHALALARVGDCAQAAVLLEGLAARQMQFGTAGLFLGATLEARTRVAIWQGDAPAVSHFARATADAYRHGQGSALGGRYQRLMQEARVAGVVGLPELGGAQGEATETDDGASVKTKVGRSR